MLRECKDDENACEDVPNKDPEKEDAEIDFKEGLYNGPPGSVSIFNCWVPAALVVPKIKGK